MTEILVTTVVGVSLLVGISFFIVWYGEHSKRMAKRRYYKKFEFIDNYLADSEKKSTDVFELLSAERRDAFSENKNESKRPSDVHGVV